MIRWIAVLALTLSSTMVLADDKPTPPSAQGSGAKASDPKTGTSLPVQTGGAGVQGKSDAGSGQTKPNDK